MIMEWDSEGKRKEKKLRKQWVDGMNKSMISKDLQDDDAEDKDLW